MALQNLLFLALVVILNQHLTNCATFQNVKVTLTSSYTRNFVKNKPPTSTITIKSDDSLQNYVNNQLLEGIIIDHQNVPLLTVNSIVDLPTIEDIRISSCGLREVQPGTFKNIPKLQSLSLRNNELRTVRAGTFSHLSMEWLNLGSNKISRIEEDAFKDAVILHLVLDHNQMANFDGNWLRKMPTLSLYMSHNLLEELPAKFMGTRDKQFWNLVLNDNNIKQIHEDAFNGLTSIGYLNLANNSVINLQRGVFNGVEEVNNMDLSNNRISEMSDELFSDMELTYVNVENNLLKCVKVDNIASKLYKIDMDGNPMSCDCVKQWEEWKLKHKNNHVTNMNNLKERCIKE